MNIFENFIQRHNQLYAELEELYNIYKFNDLIEIKKSIHGNFEHCKMKFLETNNHNSFNYLNYYEIYVKILKQESDFVLFTTKDSTNNNNNISVNISKGPNNYIVSRNGYRWFKIISKNVEIINDSICSDYYGDYSILEDIKKFITSK